MTRKKSKTPDGVRPVFADEWANTLFMEAWDAAIREAVPNVRAIHYAFTAENIALFTQVHVEGGRKAITLFSPDEVDAAIATLREWSIK